MNARQRQQAAREAAGLERPKSQAMREWLDAEWDWLEDPANVMAPGPEYRDRENIFLDRLARYERQVQRERARSVA